MQINSSLPAILSILFDCNVSLLLPKMNGLRAIFGAFVENSGCQEWRSWRVAGFSGGMSDRSPQVPTSLDNACRQMCGQDSAVLSQSKISDGGLARNAATRTSS